jgi:hypothetical protein
MSSRNLLLRSKAVRLTVARLHVTRPAAGASGKTTAAHAKREQPGHHSQCFENEEING